MVKGMIVDQLAGNLGLGELLEDLRRRGGYEILDHWRAAASALPNFTCGQRARNAGWSS
jgi:hypothetical protein